MKKIAAVTDDGVTISPHFGRATRYAVLVVEDGRITARELREKASHRDFQHGESTGHAHRDHEKGHGFGKHSVSKHRLMFESVLDCEIILAGGMGQGAYQGMIQLGISPILTDIVDITTAVQSVIDNRIENHLERLH